MLRPGEKNIGEMTHADLTQFIGNILATQSPEKATSMQQVDVHDVLNVKNKINLSPQAKASLLGSYLLSATAAATYETITHAAATYETSVHAAATYETSVHAAATYETIAAAALLAPLASPTFTGTPAAPTPVAGDNTTKLATTAFVTAAGIARNPKVTTSAWSGGPPGSPADGDIWIATAVDANGVVWQFRFNSGSASTFKWEFIGGAEAYNFVAALETTASLWTTLVDLTTFGPTIPITRSGDYEFHYSVRCSNNTANDACIAVLVSGSSAIQYVVQPVHTSSTANAEGELSVSGRFDGLAAGNNLRLMYCALTGGTASFRQRTLLVHPVRIS